MQVGVVVGTMGYLGHGIHHFWLSAITESFAFHLTMRLLFAVANALTAPVLDGLTIAYLEQQETLYGDGDDSSGGMGKADFGKERLYGAISWAMGNVMAGLLIDSFGLSLCTVWPLYRVYVPLFFCTYSLFPCHPVHQVLIPGSTLWKIPYLKSRHDFYNNLTLPSKCSKKDRARWLKKMRCLRYRSLWLFCHPSTGLALWCLF